MGLISFLMSWQFVLLFYVGVALLIYWKRDKFDFQGKIIAMYRTRLGIKSMKRLAEKHGRFVRWLGYAGIVVGYLGMLTIVFFIFQGLYNLLFVPEAPATFAPVIPGVQIPGSPIFVPFWYGMLSLFVVIVIHEFSHGVVSKAHGIPVKTSGFVLFGPIPGAFVEPDEEKLKKKQASVQNSVFAAGPFSNILTALAVMALLVVAVNPILADALETTGFEFNTVEEGLPASEAGIEAGITYSLVNGEEVTSGPDFMEKIDGIRPGEEVTIGDDEGAYTVVAGTHPENSSQGYIGITCCTTRFANEGFWLDLFLVLVRFLNWLFILSLGLGLANLLPIGPVDGGRMFQILCWKLFGKEKGNEIWAKTSLAFLGLIVVLVFAPILKAVMPAF